MKNSVRLAGISILLAAHNLAAATLYVGPGGFSTIQQAVDAAEQGDEVVVTNGWYATGSKTAGGYNLPNRVAVDKPVTVRSVNGPQVTTIQGYHAPDPFPWEMVRCVHLTSGATLSGFTLTGGGCYDRVGALPPGSRSGGGVFCESASAIVSNCVISGNWALSGGGAYGGTLLNCTLANNSAFGIGGAENSMLYSCKLTGNSVSGAGNCTLLNCLLTGNLGSYGGGASGCTLTNCTLAGNSATHRGGGVANSTLVNCIVYFNTAGSGNANYYLESPDQSLDYCCTTPLPTSGIGNIETPPLFVDTNGWRNLRLKGGLCVNAGNNAYVTSPSDLDGRPRVSDSNVDMGAYEFQPGVSGAFIGWLQQYGLPTDGSVDYADTDGDGMNNWQEWVCGTSPTDPESALRLVSAVPGGTEVTVSWKSREGVRYLLTRSLNLGSPFTVVATNILGQAGKTTYGDTNAAGAGLLFYRVGVNYP